MTSLKKWMLALTVMSASVLVHAADDKVVDPSLGQAGNKDKKSHALNDRFSSADSGGQGEDHGWAAHLGQARHQLGYSAAYQTVSSAYNGIKLRQDTLGRYDLWEAVGGRINT